MLTFEGRGYVAAGRDKVAGPYSDIVGATSLYSVTEDPDALVLTHGAIVNVDLCAHREAVHVKSSWAPASHRTGWSCQGKQA